MQAGNNLNNLMSHTTEASHRFLERLLNHARTQAQATSTLIATDIRHQAIHAVLAQANLSQEAVFELLRD